MKLIYHLLKLNRRVNNPQVKLLAIYFSRLFHIRHLSLRIDPITACNLKCKMCPVINAGTSTIRRLSQVDCMRIAAMLFPKALQVVIGCGYEPTMHRQFMHFIKMARAHRVPNIGLTTNGQLLGESHIRQFIHYGLSEIIISLHGLQQTSYERFMVNAEYTKLHRFLTSLDALKAAQGVPSPCLRINITINAENLDELPSFFNTFGRYQIDTLQIRPMHGDAYPQGRLNARDEKKYRSYLKTLSQKCSDRNITLMAHVGDLGFRRDNYAAIIFPEVFYYIDPDMVWRPDFNWRRETHNAYCRRVQYNRYLMRLVFSGKQKLLHRAELFPGSGRYDVL